MHLDELQVMTTKDSSMSAARHTLEVEASSLEVLTTAMSAFLSVGSHSICL